MAYPIKMMIETFLTFLTILVKGTVMQIEKTVIIFAYKFRKYPESFAFQLFIISL